MQAFGWPVLELTGHGVTLSSEATLQDFGPDAWLQVVNRVLQGSRCRNGTQAGTRPKSR